MPYHYDSRNYDPNAEYEPELIPPGNYLCKVEAAHWDRSKSGYEMIVMELAVKGYRSKLWYYVVAKCDTPEEQKRTDQWVGGVFAAFGLTPSPDVQVAPLVGRVGAVRVKNESYNGETKARAAGFLRREKAIELSKAQQGETSSGRSTQPQSYRTAAMGTNGPSGAPGFDRYGDSCPPAPLDISDLEPPAAAPAEEADIPF